MNKTIHRIPIRTKDSNNKRVCDLELHENGKIYIVDVEQDKQGKRTYCVCIEEQLKELLSKRKMCV